VVRLIYRSLGVKGLNIKIVFSTEKFTSLERQQKLTFYVA